MSVINNIFYAIGDSLVIDNKSILIGITSVDSFTDVTTGTTADRYFEKYFQYTIDGLNWTEWIELTNGNLQLIQTKENHIFRIRYKYVRKGTDDTGELEFVSIDLNCSYLQQSEPINFNSTPISKFLNFFNLQSLQWANNVLLKYYKRGIVPKFIERSDNNNWEDEDYIDFFWFISYSLALVVNYGREFENIIFSKQTLQDYLKGKGLFLKRDRDLTHLTYLSENFHSEIRKRGTNSILKFSDNIVEPDGELIRLLELDETDEFIFCYPETERSSWFLDKMSPEYKSLTGLSNCIKAYEKTPNVDVLSNYPLINDNYISRVLDSGYYNMALNSIPSGQISGIGNTSGNTKSIFIDSNLAYEITFFIKKSFAGNVIDFGVRGFDEFDNQINYNKADDLLTETNYFFQQKDLNLTNQYYFVRGIVYPYTKTQINAEDSKLNIGFGNSLTFKYNIRKIEPYLVVNNNTGSSTGSCYIYDFKIRPLKTDFSRCFLNSRNNIIMISKRKKTEYSDEKIDNILSHYLLPYNCNILKTYL